MKSILKTAALLAAFSVGAAFVSAQPAPKIFVIDLAKVYDDHYETQAQNAKLEVDRTKAQEELERLNREGNALMDEYRERVEQVRNPALTEEARKKAETEARAMEQDIRAKQAEVQNFQANTSRALDQRIRQFRSVLLEQISKIATDVAKRKGGNMLVDKSGPSLIGVPALLYFDPGFDITAEVMAEINKSRPAGAPAAPAAAPAPAPATGSGTSPQITVPGINP